MRTHYETEDDLKRESAFARRIEEARGCRLMKLTLDTCLIDFQIVNRKGFVIGYLEIKTSCYSWRRLKYYMISEKKWKIGLEHTARLWVGENRDAFFIIAVQFADGDMYYKYDTSHDAEITIKDGGRIHNIRDEWDKERCVYIPIKFFQPLKGESNEIAHA